jgi:hypothetical protein
MKHMKSYAQSEIIGVFRQIITEFCPCTLNDKTKELIETKVRNTLNGLLRDKELTLTGTQSFNEVRVVQKPEEKRMGKLTIQMPRWLKEQFEDEEI